MPSGEKAAWSSTVRGGAWVSGRFCPVSIRSVWPDSYVQDANLSVHIANILKILGKTSAVDQF